MLRRRGWAVAVATLLATATACGGSGSTDRAAPPTGATPSATATPATFPVAQLGVPAGAQRLHFEVGPLTVRPGQNSISYTRRIPQPPEDGWLVGMTTNLRLADGSVPPVDVIHLHHGVWLNLSRQNATSPGPDRFFAAGEEKTAMQLPAAYGYPVRKGDRWLLNYMLHNQYPKPDQVWITYDVDFVPAGSTAAAGMHPARPLWMDVENPSVYPVFDVLAGRGHDGAYTYPDDAEDPYGGGPARNTWTVDRDGVLLATAGHMHPGGQHDDLWLTRRGATAPAGHAKPGASDTVRLFSSVAQYWEPAGDVSWDVAMTATPSGWRPTVRKGDVLSITTTYSSTASWYESMGIMVVWMADAGPGDDPFTHPVDVAGVLTHGHLPENDHHGGAPDPRHYEDVTKLPSRVVASGTVLPIADFAYVGDMSVASSLPTVVQGGSLTYRNDDAQQGIYHSITACRSPCDRSTGIAYPLADASPQFDSGELGGGGPPASGSDTWKTPDDLPPGTYTFFCRIHPFMRGAFRVAAKG